MAPLGAAPLVAEQETNATCPICLCTMAAGVVSLGCGHLFHESCLTGGALRSCALCRAPVRPDRIRPASQVPGARSPSGTILDNWAQRSGALLPGLLAAPKQAPAASLPRPAHQAPRPPAGPSAGSAGHGGQRRLGGHSDAVPEATSPMPEALLERLASWQASVGPRVWGPPPQARQLGEPASGAPGQQRPRSRSSADPLAATDIPPLDSAALLEGIRLQLGAAAAAGGAAAGQPGAARLPSTFAFCLDISSSMGSSRAWQPTAVSRLCFALATLACVVDCQVSHGDWVMVAGFDAGLAVLKPWFRKPASFDKAAFLAECTRAVRHCGLRRWGTRLCAAVQQVVTDQAIQALAVAGAAAPRPPEADDSASAQHSFVLLTDGDADDGGTGFEAAAALVRDPPFEHGGFRALLMHIDFRQGHNRDWLRRLASGADGRRLPYMELLELSLPPRLNLASLHSEGSAAISLWPSGRSTLSGNPVHEPLGWPGQQREVQAGWSPAGGRQQDGQAMGAEDDSLPVRSMSRAIHAFSSTLGSAPSSRPWRAA